MFERLTVPARQGIAEAKEVARRQGADGVSTAHLVLGFLRGEQSVAGQLLRARVDHASAEAALGRLPVRGTHRPPPGVDPGGFGEEMRLVLAGAAGVVAGRAERRIGTASCLLSLLTLESPSAMALLAGLGLDAHELAEAARQADESTENAVAGLERNGTRGDWTVEVANTGSSAAMPWSDGED